MSNPTPYEVPANYVPCECTHQMEMNAWRMPNGARHVQLIDDTVDTWWEYCDSLAARNKENLQRIEAARKAGNERFKTRLTAIAAARTP